MTSKSRFFASVAAAGLLLLTPAGRAAHAADEVSVDAAQKEGRVVWYTALLLQQLGRPVAAAFEKKYPGIKVDIVAGQPPDLALKVTNEMKAGRVLADVWDGSPGIPPFDSAEAVDQYAPKSAEIYPAEIKSLDRRWTGMNYLVVSAAVNTTLVSEADAPKTWDDLLDPKWKGKMAVTFVPIQSGLPGMVGHLIKAWGEEKAIKYVERLGTQKVAQVPASARVVLDQVIAGQYPIGIQTLAYHSTISAAQGAPVRWLRLEPLQVYVNAIGLVKNGPHPNAGKLLIDFILSEEGQTIIREAGYVPAHPKVSPQDPKLKPEQKNYSFTLIQPSEDAAGEPRWREIARKYFN